MAKIVIPDLDIDMSSDTREQMLKTLYHIPASKIGPNSIVLHGIGVYFCDIPFDQISGLASIDYKKAEEDFGYIKFDFLHNSIYDGIKSRKDLFEILAQKVEWDNLYKKDIVEKLPHINNYYTLLNTLPKIDSIEKLARFIAIIRPGKKDLISIVQNTQDWSSIDETIWAKSEQYYYKKGHAISYALSITVAMKLLVNNSSNDLGETDGEN